MRKFSFYTKGEKCPHPERINQIPQCQILYPYKPLLKWPNRKKKNPDFKNIPPLYLFLKKQVENALYQNKGVK